MRDVPVAFAHRGARLHAPENTVAAFALALEWGATGLESDVWATADGAAVLDHDGVIRSRFRSRSIGSVLLRDLPDHIPTFSRVACMAERSFEFSLDVKSPEAVGPLGAAVTSSGFPAGRLWLCSPSLDVLERCRAAVPGANLVHSTRTDRLGVSLETHLSRLRELGVDVLNLHNSEWSGGRVALAHRFGILAFSWDLQHEEPLVTALRMGVDGVYSDDVPMMMKVHARETARA